jgi:hypothetical protein
MVFINGKIVAVNSIDFLPHNEVTVNVLPDYPMTIAVLANHPTVQYSPLPANWFAPDFDDSSWDNATLFTSNDVKPDQTYVPADFTGASFIWSSDLLLDNTLIFCTTVQPPKGYVKKWNTVPDLDIKGVFTAAQLATTTSPNLFVNNASGLAMGYLTRMRNAQTTIEQIAQVNDGVVTRWPSIWDRTPTRSH